MMRYGKIKNSLGRLCRSCMNDAYGIRLEPNNCRYLMYPAVCYRCGKVKNIVSDIAPFKRMKIRLTPSPKDKHE